MVYEIHRSLDQEPPSPISPDDVAAAMSARNAAGIRDGSAGSGGYRDLPGGLHMTSVPPPYWMDKVDTENGSLKTAKDSK